MFKQLSKALFMVGAISLVSLGFAENRSDYNYPARNVDSDDTNQAMSSRQRMDQMQDRVITPDAGPRVARGADVFITADFIWWRAREDGLAYAQTGVHPGPSFTSDVAKGSLHRPNFDWEPGFKVGLGLNLGHDGWDIVAQYTWLRSSPSSSSVSVANGTTNNSILPMGITVIPGLADGESVTFASGKWKLNFNVIDAELGRNFYVSKYLTTRPFVGFKGTWQDDDWTFRYRQQGTALTVREIREKNDIDYWAFGVRGGMNTGWYFTQNFCLFGDWALSALWGKWDVDIKDKLTPNVDNPETFFTTRNNTNEFYSIQSVLEWVVGLRYDYWWSDDDYHFGIQAGWEEQLWFNHNQHYQSQEEADHGNLHFQGLDLKVRFDF